MARALRFQGFVYLKLWGECVATTVYILSRLPLVLLHGKSPFEKLGHRAPFLYHIKVLGCLGFATVVKGSDKFSLRAIPIARLSYFSS